MSSVIADFLFFFRACAVETLLVVIILDTAAVRDEGSAPEINVTKSARIHDLENIYFGGL